MYEVALSIDTSIEKAYLDWLHEHIDEMLTLGCFHNAVIKKAEALNATDGGRVEYRVYYAFDKPEQFTLYEEKWALEMRKKAPDTFKGKFEARRHILSPLGIET